MGKNYVIESQFEDLRGNPADDDVDLEVDLADSDNPIIRAAFDGVNDEWTPPKTGENDDDEDDDDEDESPDTGEEDDDEVEEDDDEVEEDDEEEGDDDDDDDSSYSKDVQKRIDRERQLRLDAEAAATRRVAQLEKRLKLREAKDEHREKERELRKKLENLRKKKVEAVEEGDTEQQVSLDDEMLDLRAEIRVGQEGLKRLEADLESEDGSGDLESGGTRPPPAGEKWLAKYPEFHSNKRFRDAVLQADSMVAASGADKNDDEYYERIERIVAVNFPKIVKPKRVKVKTKKRKKPAVSAGGKPGATSSKVRKRGGKVRLTKADQANMRTFGMDPTNPQHVKAYAESKE